MALERQYNLDDLYSLYVGRMPNLTVEEELKVDLKLNKGALLNLACSHFGIIAKIYDKIRKGDKENHLGEQGIYSVWEAREILRSFLPGTKINFLAEKIYRSFNEDAENPSETWPPRSPGDGIESLCFEINNGIDHIGSYRLDHNGEKNEWLLADRLIPERKYRGQGIGSVLFAACEGFVRKYANDHCVAQKITANTAQPKVILMFLNKDFKAATPEDQRQIDLVLSADPSLELDYAQVYDEIWENGKKVVSTEWQKQTFKDLYCFEKTALRKTEQRALRINLEKVFEPKQTGVDRTIQEVRDASRTDLCP